MLRFILPLVMLAAPAMAHEGLHHHPHGIAYGWIVATATGVVGGLLVARIRGRR
jgi:hypothetical protein